MWDVASGEEKQSLRHKFPVYSVAFKTDDVLLTTDGDATLHRWEVSTGRYVTSVRGPHKRSERMALTPNGRTRVTAGEDGTVWLWDMAAAGDTLLATFAGHQDPVAAVAVAPDGSLAASAAGDEVCLWSVRPVQEVARRRVPGGTVHGLAFAPDGKALAAATHDNKVLVWDVTDGR